MQRKRNSDEKQKKKDREIKKGREIKNGIINYKIKSVSSGNLNVIAKEMDKKN